MKKVISLLCVIAIIAVSFVSASAYSWYSSTHGNECDDRVADERNTVYAYLCDNTDLNKAAICGIMGNIWAECCFNPTESYGSYHGLCQWGGSRWSSCQNYCAKQGYSSNSAAGQVRWLVYELKNNYTNTYKKLLAVSNTESGVYDAESIFRVNYEGCGTQAMSRRQSAAINYWNKLPARGSVSAPATTTTTQVATTKQTTTQPTTTKVTTTTAAPTTTKRTDNNFNKTSATANTTTATNYNNKNTVPATPDINNEEKVEEIYNSIAQVFEQVMMPADSVLPNS